jgi:hypothetical protein
LLGMRIPQMCKWNAFTIDTWVGVWEYGEHERRENLFLFKCS